jgi:hypothetical protein
LASGATAGDLVETISFFVSSVLNAIPAVANAVTETYINTGAVTQSKLGAGVAGNGPAFSAYPSATQTLSNATLTKAQYNTEEFDTASCYDTSNYRFTPNVAGYYQVQVAAQLGSGNASLFIAYIHKNGSAFKSTSSDASGNNISTVEVTALVYCNGTTDYIEAYLYQSSGGSLNLNANSQWLFFQASMVRAA